jgi:hypothetical protein
MRAGWPSIFRGGQSTSRYGRHYGIALLIKCSLQILQLSGGRWQYCFHYWTWRQSMPMFFTILTQKIPNNTEENFFKNLSLSLMKRYFIERVQLKRQRFFKNVQKPLKRKEVDANNWWEKSVKKYRRQTCGHNCKMQFMQNAWGWRAAAMKKIAVSEVNTHAFTEPETSRVEIIFITLILCEPYYS